MQSNNENFAAPAQGKTKEQEWNEVLQMCNAHEFYVGDLVEVLKYKLREASTPEEREQAFADAVEAAWMVL